MNQILTHIQKLNKVLEFISITNEENPHFYKDFYDILFYLSNQTNTDLNELKIMLDKLLKDDKISIKEATQTFKTAPMPFSNLSYAIKFDSIEFIKNGGYSDFLPTLNPLPYPNKYANSPKAIKTKSSFQKALSWIIDNTIQAIILIVTGVIVVLICHYYYHIF